MTTGGEGKSRTTLTRTCATVPLTISLFEAGKYHKVLSEIRGLKYLSKTIVAPGISLHYSRFNSTNCDHNEIYSSLHF